MHPHIHLYIPVPLCTPYSHPTPTYPTPYPLPLLGIEAERALANCLSQNTRLKKISHSFRENFVAVYVDKYLQRNLDLVRQQRVQHTITTTDTGGGEGESGGNKSNNSTPSRSGGGGGGFGEGSGSVYNSTSSKSRSGSPGIKLPAYPFPSLQGSPLRRPTGMRTLYYIVLVYLYMLCTIYMMFLYLIVFGLCLPFTFI